MSSGLYEAIVNGDSRSVQQKGAITLPAGWREKHSIEKGDEIAIRENEDGELVIIPPPES